jgi:hypothetical protein
MRIDLNRKLHQALVFQYLTRLSAWLGRFPSFTFGLAYLLAIPGFALAYNKFPFDFYHSTARYEPLVKGQAEAIAKRIRKVFVADIRRASEQQLWVDGGHLLISPNEGFPLFYIELEPEYARVIAQFAFDEVSRA